jgi:hypothetical protein
MPSLFFPPLVLADAWLVGLGSGLAVGLVGLGKEADGEGEGEGEAEGKAEGKAGEAEGKVGEAEGKVEGKAEAELESGSEEGFCMPSLRPNLTFVTMRKLVAKMEIKNTMTIFFVKKVLKYATIAKNATASKLPIIKYPMTVTTAMISMM